MIRKTINWLLRRYVDYDELLKNYEANKSKSLSSLCQLGAGSRFYAQAEVYNFLNDRSKIVIGDNTHIRGELLTFAYGGLIEIGSDSYIGEGTRIWSGERIKIGNSVLIAHNCNLIDNDSHEIEAFERAEGFKNLIKHGHSKVQGNIASAPIFVGDFAWLSYNTSVLKGVRVGKGSIVAAGSVVTKDVPDWTIVAGNPAKVVREIPQSERK